MVKKDSLFRVICFAVGSLLLLHVAACTRQQCPNHGLEPGSISEEDFLSAVKSNSVNEVTVFLRSGADPNMHNGAPLQIAVDAGYVELVQLLVKRGAKVSLSDEHGLRPLLVAAGSQSSNRVTISKFLLEQGARVNAKSKTGGTALMEAAYFGHFDVVEFLLDNGADVNTQNSLGGWTALIFAQQQGHTNVCDLLRRHGAKEFKIE